MKEKLLFLFVVLFFIGLHTKAQDTTPIATQVQLTATAAVPAGIKSIVWKQLSGPGNPIIVTPNELNTVVKDYAIPGEYIYSITVTDNIGQAWSSQAKVIVKEPWGAPTGSAKALYEIRLPVKK